MRLNLCSIVMGILVPVLALTSCTSSAARVPARVFSEHEAMSEIYSNVLADGFSKNDEGDREYCKDGELKVGSRTNFSGIYFESIATNWKEAKAYFPQLEKETWRNFTDINSRNVPVPGDLDLGCKYTLHDIPTTHTKNCTPIHYFSPIGYNSNRDQALVSHLASCNGFGCGSLYLAEFMDGHWVVTAFDDAVCLGE